MKNALAISSFVVATFLTFLGILLPPIGEIDGNVLIAIGQFILLCATMAGVGGYYEKIKELHDTLR